LEQIILSVQYLENRNLNDILPKYAESYPDIISYAVKTCPEIFHDLSYLELVSKTKSQIPCMKIEPNFKAAKELT
jgi:hypothetical protein